MASLTVLTCFAWCSGVTLILNLSSASLSSCENTWLMFCRLVVVGGDTECCLISAALKQDPYGEIMTGEAAYGVFSPGIEGCGVTCTKIRDTHLNIDI